MDHGDPTYICQNFGAKLWYAETLRRNNKDVNSYSLCCKSGQVQLPKMKDPPKLLLDLFQNQDPRSNHFIKNIRLYNMIFSFTSMGGKIDGSVNEGGGPYVFRLHGQNYHSHGSLLPSEGSGPKFAQLYIYDTENEESNRINAIGYVYSKLTCTLLLYRLYSLCKKT